MPDCPCKACVAFRRRWPDRAEVDILFGVRPPGSIKCAGWVTWHPEWERQPDKGGGEWWVTIPDSGTTHPTPEGCDLCADNGLTAESWCDYGDGGGTYTAAGNPAPPVGKGVTLDFRREPAREFAVCPVSTVEWPCRLEGGHEGEHDCRP